MLAFVTKSVSRELRSRNQRMGEYLKKFNSKPKTFQSLLTLEKEKVWRFPPFLPSCWCRFASHGGCVFAHAGSDDWLLWTFSLLLIEIAISVAASPCPLFTPPPPPQSGHSSAVCGEAATVQRLL